jgi:maltose alpha-D-glucosyltransferase/alpha-amylase
MPVEMLGYVEFPRITKQPYPLSLGAYEFLWFEIHKSANESKTEEVTLSSKGGWKATFEGADLQTLVGRVLPEFLPKQRWFGAKSRKIARISLQDWAELPGTKSALTLLSINFEDGSSSDYFLALARKFGSAATQLREQFPNAVVAQITSPDSDGILYDAIFDDDTCAALLACIGGDTDIPTQNGVIHGRSTSSFEAARGSQSANLHPNRGTAEQSNSSILFGSQLIMKLFRRQEAGENPDCEISRFLTEQTEFRRIPPFAGSIDYVQGGRPAATLAMLQGLVANEGDGWRWTLEELDRYYENCARHSQHSASPPAKKSFIELAEKEETSEARAELGIALDAGATLGRRTAEMHAALATGKDADFIPEALGRDAIRRLALEMEEHAVQAFAKLKESLPRFTEDATEQAAFVLSRRRQVLDRFRQLKDLDSISLRTRIHGDYHLGQVLRVKNDFVVLDFEGEPTKPLAERRAKHSPLKDVAGMLRSFSYAAHVGLANYTARRPESLESLRGWGQFWEQSVAASFLRAYRQEAANASFLPASPAAIRALLEAYLLDKAFYELNYELENRPTWVRIPLAGILALEI